MLPVSLDCVFLIAPSVFSSVYFSFNICLCNTGINTYCVVFLFCLSTSCVYYMLPVSLDCVFLIVLFEFSNVYIISISQYTE